MWGLQKKCIWKCNHFLGGVLLSFSHCNTWYKNGVCMEYNPNGSRYTTFVSLQLHLDPHTVTLHSFTLASPWHPYRRTFTLAHHYNLQFSFHEFRTVALQHRLPYSVTVWGPRCTSYIQTMRMLEFVVFSSCRLPLRHCRSAQSLSDTFSQSTTFKSIFYIPHPGWAAIENAKGRKLPCKWLLSSLLRWIERRSLLLTYTHAKSWPVAIKVLYDSFFLRCTVFCKVKHTLVKIEKSLAK